VNQLAIRHRLLLVVVATVAMALAAMIVGFNLLLAHNLGSDADRLLRARASGELALLAVKGGRVVVSDAPDDATTQPDGWVFAGGRTLEAPTASRLVSAAARKLAGRAPGFHDVPTTDTRLYAEPVVVSGQRYGAVVASVSLEPYEQTRSTALLASLALGGAVLLLVGLAARWLLASSLRPVARMTRLASEWSERDLERRFAVGDPRDELTELAATLDALLGRLAASLRREQRFSAELSHELRTPLSRVIAETELALRAPRAPEEYRSALELIRANAEQLSRTIDALVAAARHESGALRGTSDAFAVAGAAAEACSGLAAERDVVVEVEPPQQPVRLGVEGDLAERVLQPVVENACRYGRARVRVSISRRDEGVVYRIADDGPGVDDAEREQIFEPGERGGAGAANGSGAGLGLALARRLARSVTGEVTAVAERGGVFLVRLPAA
jgi:two-component system OmpR family sensor kinase